MASLKVKLRPSTNKDEGVLYYQIIHQRIIRQITTNFKVFNYEWNTKDERIIISNTNYNRVGYLESIKYKIQNDKRRFESIIHKLGVINGLFTIDDIVEKFTNQSENSSLFIFMEKMIANYKRNNQVRTSETYQCTLNSLKRFRENKDLDITDLNKDFVMSYEHYLKTEGVQHNTISFYMHKLRAVYNNAVDQELVEQRYPFKHIKINIEKTVKRAIPVKYIKRLKQMNLKEGSSKSFARDMFLFSFYTRGMSFIDIAYLQKKDLKYNVLTYRRKKTGQKLHIHWESCMEQILKLHKSEDKSPYLFSIISDLNKDERTQYHNKLTLINRNLKLIGKEIGLEIPLTMYVARHSWATTARSEGIPLSVISEGMGHENEKTTQIYLASLDTQIIDDANRKIIKLV